MVMRPWSDEELLTALELRHDGYTAGEIAQRLPGRSRSGVIGALGRVDLAHEPGAERLDGTLGRGWWRR